MRIALGLLAALQVLHPKELVHWDLKPSNMFLTENGVKIIDFGLARLSRAVLCHQEARGELTIPIGSRANRKEPNYFLFADNASRTHVGFAES